MGCGREGFNLFHRLGRRCFFKRGILGDPWARKYVLRDTFGRYVCMIIGHSKNTFLTDDDPPRKVCNRCFKGVI